MSRIRYGRKQAQNLRIGDMVFRGPGVGWVSVSATVTRRGTNYLGDETVQTAVHFVNGAVRHHMGGDRVTYRRVVR